MKNGNTIKYVCCSIYICFILLFSGCATVDWEKAIRANSAMAYKSFLKKHEQSEYTSEAKERLSNLEDEEWERAKRLHTLRGYKEFFHIYPNTKFISELKAYVKDVLTEIAVQESNNDPKLLHRLAENKPLISVYPADNESCRPLEVLGGSAWWGDAIPIEWEEDLKRWYGNKTIGPEVARINSLPIKAYNDPTDILQFMYQEIERAGGKECCINYVSGTGVVVIGDYVQCFNIFKH